MKHASAIVATALAVVVLGSCARSLREVSVSGSGELTFVPDMAVFSVTVKNVNPRLNDSLAQTKETMKAILGACKEFGVADVDVKSGFVSSGKEYQYNNRTERQDFLGYSAAQSTQITLRDISRFEELSGKLLSLGIASLDNLSFSHSKLSEYASQADLLALDDAKASAQKLAQRIGRKLGAVRFISNNGSAPDSRLNDMELARGAMAFSKSLRSGIVVAPGILAVSRQVDAVFELE